jgi:hypothetical protein
MADPKLPLLIVLALVPIAVAFRYLLEQSSAAKLIGIRLAPPDFLAVEKSGHQDAVTPPEANKWFFLSLALLVAGVVGSGLAFGWLYGVLGVVVVYLSGVVAQVFFLPKKNSRHFVLSIFNSMSRRCADYERDGDKQRAAAMGDLLNRFMLAYGSVMTSPAQPERIISKSDADYIFSLDRAGWEAYAERMVHPGGWTLARSPSDTGTRVIAVAPDNSMGLSTQPFYDDPTKPPSVVLIGSYYPAGKLGGLAPKRQARLQADAQADLGSDYTVTVSYSPPPHVEGITELEGIDLMVMRSDARRGAQTGGHHPDTAEIRARATSR